MPAPNNMLTTLPTELLNIIGEDVSKADLASLLLTNSSINSALTPLLYASITIKNYVPGLKCADILAADPTEHHAHRNLAAYVRSFTVSLKAYRMAEKRKARFARSFEGALNRMSGLQSFTLHSAFLGTPNIWMAFARGAARTLRSLCFTPDDESDVWPDESDAHAFDGVFRPDFLELTSIVLFLDHYLLPAWYVFFRHVLVSRGAQLRTLSIYDYHGPSIGHLFPEPGAWSALEELKFTIRNTPMAFADFPPGPHVRRLTLDTSFFMVEPNLTTLKLPSSIPAHVFPNLEYLACPYQLLPVFLPAGTSSQRPIRTVRLNHAYYDPHGQAVDSFTEGEDPPWSNVHNVLSSLPRSTGPVVDLAFYVDWFDAETFPSKLAEYVRTVERLVVVVRKEPGNGLSLQDFGKKLFAHTPRLQAFFLSDAPLKAADSEGAFFTFIWDQQKPWLREWDKYTSVLKEVAFTTEHSWKKTDDGWAKQRSAKAESSDEEDEYDENDEEL